LQKNVSQENEQIRFKERLLLRRNRLNLTQPALAELSGISSRSISDYERGLSLPSFEQIQKLAAALGVTMGWLIGENETIPAAMALPDAPATDAFEDFWERLHDLNLAAAKLRPAVSSKVGALEAAHEQFYPKPFGHRKLSRKSSTAKAPAPVEPSKP